MLKNAAVLWIIAFLLTAASAVYQRMTGPTYPVRTTVQAGGEAVDLKLHRSHGGDEDCRIEFAEPDTAVSAVLHYKRYKTDDPWTRVEMLHRQDTVYGHLPHQPPAGKLRYYLTLESGGETIRAPEGDDVIIRFKGAVPRFILIPHVFIMFAAMFLSTRAGLEALFRDRNTMQLAYWAAGLLFVGGMILGPVMQEYAFGELWTGVPFGYDLTDNKTLISMIGWIVAIWYARKGVHPRRWILFASVLQLIIYIIPHSVLGSELDYSEMDGMK